jgi:hypothetical protein
MTVTYRGSPPLHGEVAGLSLLVFLIFVFLRLDYSGNASAKFQALCLKRRDLDRDVLLGLSLTKDFGWGLFYL